MLFKSIVLAMLLWSSPYLSATSVQAGLCAHLPNEWACTNYPTGECIWDEIEQRCENKNEEEDRCERIRNPRRCENSPFNCFWNYEEQKCVRRF